VYAAFKGHERWRLLTQYRSINEEESPHATHIMKDQIVTINSQTCFITTDTKGTKRTKALAEYKSKHDAKEGAKYVFDRFGGSDVVPYQCQTCHLWHLSPWPSRSETRLPVLLNKPFSNLQSTNSGGVDVCLPTSTAPSGKAGTKTTKMLSIRTDHAGLEPDAPQEEKQAHSHSHKGRQAAPTTININTQANYPQTSRRLAPTKVKVKAKANTSTSAISHDYQATTAITATLKSKTCFGHHSGAPLTQYATRLEAQEASKTLAARHNDGDSDGLGLGLVPYKCRNSKCRHWHLTPRDRQTPNVSSRLICDCVDSSGVRHKNAYLTRTDALRRAEISLQEKGQKLWVYSCNEGAVTVWHLTSHFSSNRRKGPLGRRSLTCWGKSASTSTTTNTTSGSGQSAQRNDTNNMIMEYDYYEEAVDAAEFAKETSAGRYDLRVYECEVCDKWHLAPWDRTRRYTDNHTYTYQRNATSMKTLGKESETCRSTSSNIATVGSGNMQREYKSWREATEAAEYAHKRYGNLMVPHLCGMCSQIHLGPATSTAM
jgi:hypothetical protein